MTSWQYKLIDSNAFKKPSLMRDFAPADVESYLNTLGQEGWEIIHFYCKFKIKDIESFHGLAKREGTDQSESSAPVQQ